MTYAEKLKDPRWQKKRLEIMQAADWTCKKCLSQSKTLHVHHGYYEGFRDPWDYPNWSLHCFCDKCHTSRHAEEQLLKQQIAGLSADNYSALGRIINGLICLDRAYHNEAFCQLEALVDVFDQAERKG